MVGDRCLLAAEQIYKHLWRKNTQGTQRVQVRFMVWVWSKDESLRCETLSSELVQDRNCRYVVGTNEIFCYKTTQYPTMLILPNKYFCKFINKKKRTNRNLFLSKHINLMQINKFIVDKKDVVNIFLTNKYNLLAIHIIYWPYI